MVSGGCTEPCFTNASAGGSWSATHNAIINSGAIDGLGLSDATLTTRYGSIVLPTFYDTSLATNYSGAPFASYSTVNTDYHGFALTGTGPWRNAASDGTDPGVNFSTLDGTLPPSPNGGLPPPQVIFGDLPINQVLTVVNALVFAGYTFDWTFTPGAVSASGTIQSRVSSANSIAASGSAVQPLTAGLSIGSYQVTVSVMDGNNPVATVSGQITFTNADLSGVKVYPNPWRSDKHAGKSVTFANLPERPLVKLFTVGRHKVRGLNETGGQAPWDLTNDSGDKVASGIYVYLITDGQGNKVKGKVAVIK